MIDVKAIERALERGSDVIIRRQRIDGKLTDTVFESKMKILERVQPVTSGMPISGGGSDNSGR